ncbi:hypothetical protein VTI28DRAFT_203 [Corynascus sepedonium]
MLRKWHGFANKALQKSLEPLSRILCFPGLHNRSESAFLFPQCFPVLFPTVLRQSIEAFLMAGWLEEGARKRTMSSSSREKKKEITFSVFHLRALSYVLPQPSPKNDGEGRTKTTEGEILHKGRARERRDRWGCGTRLAMAPRLYEREGRVRRWGVNYIGREDMAAGRMKIVTRSRWFRHESMDGWGTDGWMLP